MTPLVAPWFTLSPLEWLGDAASEAVGEAWTSAMVASWSSALWVLNTAFRGVDAATTPDLSATGPMGSVYPYTFGIGLTVALIMGFAQIGAAAYRRDGQSLGRLLVGVLQFGAVWLGYVGVAAALVTAAAGLTQGLLHELLGIDSFAGYQPGADWPRQVTDTVTASVLGICAWLLIWPAAIIYLLLMLVREASLMLLAATSPIAAAGLLSDVGRAWFWKSLRWFISALLIAPLSALVLGIGQKISRIRREWRRRVHRSRGRHGRRRRGHHPHRSTLPVHRVPAAGLRRSRHLQRGGDARLDGLARRRTEPAVTARGRGSGGRRPG